MVKPNPVTAGWATHKLENNNIKEVLAPLRRFKAPHQSSAWVSGQGTGNSQGIWLRCSTGLDHSTFTGLRTTETPLLEGTTKPYVHQTQEKWTVTPQETEPDLPENAWGSLTEVWVGSGLTWWNPGKWALESVLLEVTNSPTIEPVESRTELPLAKQFTRRKHNSTH